MTEKLSEKIKGTVVIVPQDIGTADITTTVYTAVKGYKRFLARLISVSLAQTQTATIQLMQATSAGGAGAKVLGDLQTFTSPTGGAIPDFTTDISSGELDKDNGFVFIGMRIGTSVNGSLGAGLLEGYDADFLPIK